jgi:hypothetical protein
MAEQVPVTMALPNPANAVEHETMPPDFDHGFDAEIVPAFVEDKDDFFAGLVEHELEERTITAVLLGAAGTGKSGIYNGFFTRKKAPRPACKKRHDRA